MQSQGDLETPLAVVKLHDTFATRQQMTTAVKAMALTDGGRMVTCDKGGSRQASYRCAGRITEGNKEVGCTFRVMACKQTRAGVDEFKVTSIKADHANCSGKAAKRRPGAAVLQVVGSAIVDANPKISDKALAASLKSRVGHDPKQWTTNRVKKRALEQGDVAMKEGFHALPSFLDELAKASGGTITDHQWHTDGSFKRCFVMLGQSARAAARNPQQVFCMDCYHLKGNWNGILCLMTMKDADNKLAIVCMVVSAVDNADVYDYTLLHAKKNPDMAGFVNHETTTYFVGGHKGLGTGLPRGVPLSEGRRCLRHLVENITPVVGANCEKLIFEAARAPNEMMFNESMDKVKVLKPASYHKIMALPRSSWANYACRSNHIWDQVTSNMSENANDMIGDLREKPVFDMVKGLVELCAKKLYDRSKLLKSSPQVFTPFAQDTYNNELQQGRLLDVKPCSDGVYITATRKLHKTENKVHLTVGTDEQASVVTCTCGFFTRYAIPCRDMLAVCSEFDMLAWANTLIGKDFMLAQYRASAFTPALAVSVPIWSQLVLDPTRRKPLPVKLAGRPSPRRRKKRISSAGEVSTSSRCNIPLSAVTRPGIGAGSGAGVGDIALSQGSTAPITID